MENAEAIVNQAVQWLKLVIEVTGAALIAIGFATAVIQFLFTGLRGQTESFTAIRLTLARYLALALEFQLGADILSTAIAPGWEQIGRLAAIAVIRTGLNYFLSREMKDERTVGETQKKGNIK